MAGPTCNECEIRECKVKRLDQLTLNYNVRTRSTGDTEVTGDART